MVFGGFRKTVYFGSSSKEAKDDAVQTVSGGVYRTYREEFYGNGSLPDPPKRLNPSMVKLPESKVTPKPIQNAKSVPDLRQPSGSAPVITKEQSKSTVNVTQQSQKPQPSKRISEKIAKSQEKELKKIEKERLAAEKKVEAERKKAEKKQKADAAKEAKLRAAAEAKQKKDREKAEKDRLKREGNKKVTTSAPPPPPLPNSQVNRAPGVPEVKVTNPLARKANPLAQVQPAYAHSTNTIGSTISTSSGPPPYTEEIQANKADRTGNTSFSKPIEEGSNWDFISQHRQQMSRPLNVGDKTKRTQLQYSVGNIPKIGNEGNSEA